MIKTKKSSKEQIIGGDIKEEDKLVILRKNKEALKKIIPSGTLLSESSFAKTWLNKKENEAWKDLSRTIQ